MSFFILALLVTFFLFPRSASAHVLATDGSVGAVMHISPDDDPIAGAPADFYFEFKDTSGKFSPSACNCTFAVSSTAKLLVSKPLFDLNPNPNLSTASLTYTFPARGVYTITLIGQPVSSGTFTPFTLTYDIRVSRDTHSKSSPSWLSTPVLLSLVISAIILLIFILKKSKRG